MAVRTRAAQPGKTPEFALLVDAAEFQCGPTPASLRARKPSWTATGGFTPTRPQAFGSPRSTTRLGRDPRAQPISKWKAFRSRDGVGGYRKRFRQPAGDGRFKLRFEGVYSGAEVWVNGRRLAYHEGGALPFEVDITDAVRARRQSSGRARHPAYRGERPAR